MNKIKIAYIAGLFDGEGDVAIQKYKSTKNNRYYLRLYLRITNTNIECLNFVKKTLKYGWVGYLSKGIKNKKHKKCYCFRVSNKKAEQLLKTLRPYLIIKREKAKMLLRTKHTGRCV